MPYEMLSIDTWKGQRYSITSEDTVDEGVLSAWFEFPRLTYGTNSWHSSTRFDACLSV